MQVAKTEPPGWVSIGLADQQVADPLVLGLQLRFIALTALAHAKGPACECNADALLRHSFHGHLSALGWPRHCRPSASFRCSFCMLSSAKMLITRLFSSWMVFISVIVEVAMPPNFERQP